MRAVGDRAEDDLRRDDHEDITPSGLADKCLSHPYLLAFVDLNVVGCRRLKSMVLRYLADYLRTESRSSLAFDHADRGQRLP
jgi:hypothetical protein